MHLSEPVICAEMWAFTYISIFVVSLASAFIYLHYNLHGTINPYQASLALFLSINTLISLWEVTLFWYRKLIKQQFTEFKKVLPKFELPSPMFFFHDISLSQALSFRWWSLVWSTYSLLDPSYSDSTTWGFCVDVGNGHTTLIPSFIFGIGMSYPIFSARIIGLIGFVSFYQECYGTIIYFFSYILNERYVGAKTWHLWLVIFSNSIWIVFPVIGMFASYSMIEHNDTRFFH